MKYQTSTKAMTNNAASTMSATVASFSQCDPGEGVGAGVAGWHAAFLHAEHALRVLNFAPQQLVHPSNPHDSLKHGLSWQSACALLHASHVALPQHCGHTHVLFGWHVLHPDGGSSAPSAAVLTQQGAGQPYPGRFIGFPSTVYCKLAVRYERVISAAMVP